MKHLITAPGIGAVTNVFRQRAMMFRLHAGNNKIGAKSTFSSLETLGLNRPKEAMGSENDGKANMCLCAVKETGVKTD